MDKARPSVSEDESLMGCIGNTNGANDQDSDANFFKVISENLKYAFQSPLPNTQFPTPYSNQQQQQQQQQQLRSNGGENSSSLLENSILPGLQVGSASSDMNNANVNISGEPLNDKDMQPSSVLQFGNTFPNEFLLTSPEQFREFLFESPAAGFNLAHKTPAKTPLRFVSDSHTENCEGFQSNGLFGNPSSIKSNKDYNMNKLTQTPLRNIDLNLMFNANQMAVSSSPSKKLTLSLTPYGRKVLNDIGTPYAKTLLSSNSALTDFQRARKIQSTPPTLKKSMKTPQPKPRMGSLDIHDGEQLSNFSLKIDERMNNNENCGGTNLSYRAKLRGSANKKLKDPDPDEEGDIYGSSPTTIQLNSSVTKSNTKLNANKIPILSREIVDSNIDNELFKVEDGRLPLSPTPKCHKSTTSLDTLTIPELPKMGSFKSERTLSISSNKSTSSNNSNTTLNFKQNKVKKNSKKQPKFQIIVANTQRFNVPTTNQKTSKKFTSLKRSQSLLVGSSSNAARSNSNSGLNNSTMNTTSKNNDTNCFMNNKGKFNSKKAKRSNSFSDKDKGQFYEYQ